MVRSFDLPTSASVHSRRRPHFADEDEPHKNWAQQHQPSSPAAFSWCTPALAAAEQQQLPRSPAAQSPPSPLLASPRLASPTYSPVRHMVARAPPPPKPLPPRPKPPPPPPPQDDSDDESDLTDPNAPLEDGSEPPLRTVSTRIYKRPAIPEPHPGLAAVRAVNPAAAAALEARMQRASEELSDLLRGRSLPPPSPTASTVHLQQAYGGVHLTGLST